MANFNKLNLQKFIHFQIWLIYALKIISKFHTSYTPGLQYPPLSLSSTFCSFHYPTPAKA